MVFLASIQSIQILKETKPENLANEKVFSAITPNIPIHLEARQVNRESEMDFLETIRNMSMLRETKLVNHEKGMGFLVDILSIQAQVGLERHPATQTVVLQIRLVEHLHTHQEEAIAHRLLLLQVLVSIF